MNVLVIGAGAVGSFLGATLAEAGETVCLLRRSGTAGFRQEMLTLGEPSGDVRDVQVGVAGSVDAVPWMPDILLFAVKMPDLPGALETAAHWPAATVLAVENGVGADDLIVDERPAAWLIAGSLTASLETDRGTIRRLSRGGLGPSIVSYNKSTDEVQNLGPLFDSSMPYAWYGWSTAISQRVACSSRGSAFGASP